MEGIKFLRQIGKVFYGPPRGQSAAMNHPPKASNLFLIRLYFLQTPGEVGTVQSGGQVKVRRGQMVDKGQVTEDIEAEMSASHRPMSAPGSPSEHCQAPGNDGTSIGHRVVLLHVTLTCT